MKPHQETKVTKNILKKLVLYCFLFLSSATPVFAQATESGQATRIISIEEFIKTAVENDTVFERILIDELALKYQKTLGLPARDLVLSIKREHEFDLDRHTSEPTTTVSLSKLFPYTGTDISAGYSRTTSGGDSSDLTVLISQSIARNAFGRGTILQGKIIGMETEVARHQIVEAYEDYLALVIAAYYNWYAAYKNLEIGESSYQQSLKLFENIRKRQKSKIALPIDVNKINIQTLAKKESLITVEENYKNILNFIKKTIRYKGSEVLEPADPFMYDKRKISFDEDYEEFEKASRTYQILKLLEEKSSLEVKKDADDLLPSINLLLGYTREGEDIGIENAEEIISAGLSLTWPIPNQKERAEYEVSKIENRKTRLSHKNKYIQLHTDLKNLSIQIEREKKLISITEEKIKLAESILKDETENYSYGKVSLNDFIDAVNRVDENKFSLILHSVRLKILMTEWFRMTDRLILRKNIKKISE